MKLGYGGTKSEMERLLADAEKLSGQTYSIDNLGDVYDAIHVIQGDLGLTGVAAAEASGTFSGSFGAMKAAAQNFLGSLSLGQNVSGSLNQLITSASTFFFNNFLPMIGTLVKSLPGALITWWKQGLPLLVSNVTSLLTSLATQITSVANGLSSKTISQWATTQIPKILKAGAKLVMQLASSLIKNLPKIVMAIGKIGLAIVKGLGSALWGKVKAAGQGIVTRFMDPIKSLIGKVKNAVHKIKSIFPLNLGKIMNLKIPKISVSGGKAPWGIGGKGTKPSFSVSWASHAAGGIFPRRTLMSAGDTIHEFGERGPEAIIPLDPFWKKLDQMTSNAGGTNIVININGANKDPREIADEVKRALIRETNQRRLAWQ